MHKRTIHWIQIYSRVCVFCGLRHIKVPFFLNHILSLIFKHERLVERFHDSAWRASSSDKSGRSVMYKFLYFQTLEKNTHGYQTWEIVLAQTYITAETKTAKRLQILNNKIIFQYHHPRKDSSDKVLTLGFRGCKTI